VRLQHDMLTEGLHVNHLRLVMGTSMGCMHSWVWTETYPDFMDAAMPLACLPVDIAGRNRLWRKALMDAVRNDPKWNNGNYTEEPVEGLTDAEHLLIVAGLAPLQAQKTSGTRELADKMLADRVTAALKTADANDMLYYVDASRNYNPEPSLEKVRVPVMAVNSADDFINPPELGIMERDIKRMARGRYVLIPISDETRGHGSHTVAKLWKNYLAELLQESQQGGRPSASATNGAENLQTCNSLTAAGTSPIVTAGPGVTPAREIYTPQPQFPEDMRRRKIQGEARLCLIVGEDGLVKASSVLSATDPSFGETSQEAVQQWRFQAAMRDGQPVAMRVTVETSFHLQ
jgi:TonB family protein